MTWPILSEQHCRERYLDWLIYRHWEEELAGCLSLTADRVKERMLDLIGQRTWKDAEQEAPRQESRCTCGWHPPVGRCAVCDAE